MQKTTEIILVKSVWEPYSSCLQPIVRGGCKLHLKRYGWVKAEKKCREFNYSGCGGNRNRFLRKYECRQKL
ncbi:Kunitz-type U1-aranetoxin-Av1a [Armadillidium nasatum]|uniref:Kunitz-type U1-aranetoxin-Av1a n=1 Tax=Armadillidium nasatum TaxID=96803 RepID=A0A5N5T750_9CRUS|nr:Kunitz-type U1-aranetoxin-Av1a [Armadillidium nasatum]